jgi:hypothetical protein
VAVSFFRGLLQFLKCFAHVFSWLRQLRTQIVAFVLSPVPFTFLVIYIKCICASCGSLWELDTLLYMISKSD